MLYFLYGTDEEKAREKYRALIEGLQAKRKDVTLFRINAQNWESDKFEELLHGRDLFGGKYIVSLNQVFELPEAKELVLAHLKDLAESPNIFLFLEKSLDKATLSKIGKHAEKAQEFTVKDEGLKIKDKFNVFGVTDALGERDRKKLWVLLQKAYLADLPAEEIFWSLVWIVKAIAVAQVSKSALEAGQKPFVYQKCSRFAKNFKPGEIAKLHGELSRIYHESRRGKDEFDIALERLALSL